MSSKKFTLRLKAVSRIGGGRLSNPNNNAEAAVCRKKIISKDSQLKEAVAWCREINVRGHTPIQSGLFPLIKSRKTINKRLDGKVITDQEKKYCSILLPEEEDSTSP